jgi:hypothetical protein
VVPRVSEHETTRAGETSKSPEKMRKPLEMLLEGRVCGEKDLNTVNVAPYLQKHPRPPSPERREATTRRCSDREGKPKHDGDSPSEARALIGVPKHHRSTA